ncbi:MAG: dihydrolipoamide acetyltransferase family protein [Chloroflexota bacterium]|nr:dihydrolipoamide acetyltransferase family protein [Chloroflexota bacterium]
MPREINLPQWGMAMNDGTVIKWLKSQGEEVKKGDELVEIESTKVNAAVQAPSDGTLGRIDVQEGTLVPVGTVLGLILLDGENLSDIPAKTPEPKEEKIEPNSTKPLNNSQKKITASPRARNLSKKLNVDLSKVSGTGPSGRITEEDVKLFSENGASLENQVNSHESLVLEEIIEPTTIRGVIAKRMSASSQNPQVTLNSKACVDSLINFQKKLISEWRREKIRPQINDILVKIVSNTLKEHSKLNAHFENSEMKIWKNINLGVAMAVSDGLVVPVIKNSQEKDFLEISKEIRIFSKKLKDNKILPDEISGSSFTISNLSSYNIEYFNPIINPPEVAILGVGKVSKEVSFDEKGQPLLKSFIFLSLTFDHRVLDGVPASNFMDTLIKNIESI